MLRLALSICACPMRPSLATRSTPWLRFRSASTARKSRPRCPARRKNGRSRGEIFMRTLSRLFLLFAGLATASAADLAFQRIVLLEYEDGPPLAPGFEHRPGETVWFNARVTGFQ